MKIAITAGGTGGHIFPALAIINKIKSHDKNSEFLYFGTTDRMEKDIIPEKGIPYIGIEMKGLNRKNILKNITVLKIYLAAIKKAEVELKKFKPDIVVNATGSVPLVPPITGLKENITAGNVATIFDMINNLKAGKYPDEFCKDKEVVVVGGGSVGLDVVEYFAPRGAKCTIIDMLPQIGMLADPITKCSMRETHDKYGVKEYVNTALQEVKENAFTVKLPDGEIKDIKFDLGFNCLGMRANNPILDQLNEAFADTETYVYPIGDSVRARRIMEGTMEGRAILNVLEARGFLDLSLIEE